MVIEQYLSDAEQAIDILMQSHNDGVHYAAFEKPQLAIVTCMDFRIRLQLPDDFAFVLRTGGANPGPIEPYLAFSVARMGIHAIAIIGHTDCAMQRPDPYVVNDLPTSEEQKKHFRSQIASLAITDAAEFTVREAEQLQDLFGLPVIPLIYDVHTHKISKL